MPNVSLCLPADDGNKRSSRMLAQLASSPPRPSSLPKVAAPHGVQLSYRSVLFSLKLAFKLQHSIKPHWRARLLHSIQLSSSTSLQGFEGISTISQVVGATAPRIMGKIDFRSLVRFEIIDILILRSLARIIVYIC